MATKKEKVRPEVEIVLDKPRSLKFDLNAMVDFEGATGKSILDGAFQPGNMTARELRAMLWACLRHEDEDLTERQVGAWVTVDSMMKIAEKLNLAFEVAMPESEGEPEAPLAERPQDG